MTPSTEPESGERGEPTSLVPCPGPTSSIAGPLADKKLVGHVPPDPATRYNSGESNSEVPGMGSSPADGSVVKDTSIPDPDIPHGSIDIQSHAPVHYLASPDGSPDAREEPAGTWSGFVDLLHETQKLADIWTEKLVQFKEDIEKINSKLSARDRWRTANRISAGEIAVTQPPEGDIKVHTMASEKVFDKLKESGTGRGEGNNDFNLGPTLPRSR
ncbi:hypothetical protein HOY80DRAFT_1114762 [Tuber brumale]|nr:hypothetical protein HOY80DRAFT_1114762 [Tuber brumale]